MLSLSGPNSIWKAAANPPVRVPCRGTEAGDEEDLDIRLLHSLGGAGSEIKKRGHNIIKYPLFICKIINQSINPFYL